MTHHVWEGHPWQPPLGAPDKRTGNRDVILVTGAGLIPRQTRGREQEREGVIKGVEGKVIEKIVTSNEEEQVYIDIHFQDKTACLIYVSPADIHVESAEVLGWKDGNSPVIRKLL